MKRRRFILMACLVLLSGGLVAGLFSGCKQDFPYRNGDVIFQVTASSVLSLAVREAQQSPYTHCGIVCEGDGQRYVYEAGRTVRLTPWQ